jgi:hypothetical protein
VNGDFPSDGKSKPVAFPEPTQSATNVDGIRCLALEPLIELKLASGMSPGHRKDLGDVQELIRFLGLPKELSDRLDPYVQALFLELWNEVRTPPPEA